MKIRVLMNVLLVFCMITLLLEGCVSSGTGSETSYLDGYVTAETDISDAGLQIVDTDGNIIAEKQSPATSEYGAFMITVQNLPDEFRVVSSGGTEWGEDINYTLMGQFEDFNPDTDMIYLNYVTTMICLYLDNNPDKSLSEATNAVKYFLDIPADIDIGAGLYHHNEYFSPMEFERQAPEGDVIVFLEMLVDQITQASDLKHAFTSQLVMGTNGGGGKLATCAGASLSIAARNGLIAWGAGFALDNLSGELFPSGGGPTKAQKEELKNMLIQIEAQIAQLGSQVRLATDEIKAAIKKSEYNIGSMGLAEYVTLVENTFIDLKNEIMKDPATLTEAELGERENTINHKLNIIGDKIEPYLGSFHKKIFGDQVIEAEGLLKIYTDKLLTEQRFIHKENYQDKVEALFLYYNQIEATELYLAVEFYHARGMSQTIADTHTTQLGTNSQAELDWYNSKDIVPDDLYIYHSDKYKLMIYMPDNWRELMSVDNSQASIDWWNSYKYTGGLTVPIYSGLMYMLHTDYYTRESYDGPCTPNADKGLYGFGNWRIPAIDWARDMFDGWDGASPGAFAKSQGLAPMTGSECFIPCWQEAETGPTPLDEYLWYQYWRGNFDYGFFHYNTLQGTFPWMYWDKAERNNFNFMPVREMQPGELSLYFW